MRSQEVKSRSKRGQSEATRGKSAAKSRQARVKSHLAAQDRGDARQQHTEGHQPKEATAQMNAVLEVVNQVAIVRGQTDVLVFHALADQFVTENECKRYDK